MPVNAITISGFKEYGDKLNQLAAKFPQDLDDAAKFAAQTWAQRAQLAAPKDQGSLNKIFPSKISQGAWEVNTSTGALYAPYMEWGTKSHVSVPAELSEYASQFIGGSPGGDAKALIYAWVLRKGLPASAQWPIFISIMRNGVKPHPFFFIQRPAAEAQLLADLKQMIATL